MRPVDLFLEIFVVESPASPSECPDLPGFYENFYFFYEHHVQFLPAIESAAEI